MKDIKFIKNILSDNKEVLRNDYKVKNIGIFGSYVRKANTKKSDVDILVEFFQTPDMFEFMQLEEFLTKLLGIKVDLVSRKALKPFIKNEILKEVRYA